MRLTLQRGLGSLVMVSTAIIACIIATPTRAGNATPDPATLVALVETDDAQCLVNDGQLVSLQLKDSTQSVEVWVDRWFMQVQTADHTRHVLGPQQQTVDLGCSRSSAGPQHWTLHHVTLLP